MNPNGFLKPFIAVTMLAATWMGGLSPTAASAQKVQEFAHGTTSATLAVDAGKVVQSFASPGGGATVADDSQTTYDLLYSSLQDWVAPEMTLPMPAAPAPGTARLLPRDRGKAPHPTLGELG